MNLFVLFPAIFLLCVVPSDSRSYFSSNVCAIIDNKPRCCTGWKLDPITKSCTKPICATRGCEALGGTCISPNTCKCPGRTRSYLAYSCYVKKTFMTDSCTLPCKNGGICTKDKCKCKEGFSGIYCERVSCPNDCSLQGECQRDGKCKCNYGHQGKDCSELTVAPCYTKVSRGLCEKDLKGKLLPMDVCCGTIGAAWGTPCKKCSTPRCEKGYKYKSSTRQCEDINECQELEGAVCRGGTCHNSDGKFRCSCPSGMKYNEKKLLCENEDDMYNYPAYYENECSRNPGVCGKGQCIANSNGGYRCKCYTGYTLSADGMKCQRGSYLRPLNVCSYNPYLCANGRCISTGRSFICSCNFGYESSIDGRSCKKKQNFCEKMNYRLRLCPNGACEPLGYNDYKCRCNEGFELSSDHRACVSICEKFGGLDPCENGQCIPSTNGYSCKCNEGYYQSYDQKRCVRIRDVIRTTACDYYSDICEHGRCVVVGRNDYRCVCNPGYESSLGGKKCTLIEQKQRHFCDDADYYCPNAKCIRIGRNYRCECSEGFVWENQRCKYRGYKKRKSKKAATKSQDANEMDYCKRYREYNPCENGQCHSTERSFYCTCNEGYYAVDDRKMCKKKDYSPRKLTNGLYDFCSYYAKDSCLGGICHNEPTKFWCTCLSGYRWSANNLKCEKDEQQELVSDQWSAYSNPLQKKYDWSRHSPSYFSTCDKIGRDVCGKGYCVDKGSSFECKCYEGYESLERNKRCVDINECERNPSVCWQGKCVNTPGSYSCQCLKGFKLSHVNQQPMCVDINECDKGNPCINGNCRNTWGSYKCVCDTGYRTDESGQQCIPTGSYKTEKSEPGAVTKLTSFKVPETSDYVTNCSLCAYDCMWISNGRYRCECPKGLTTLGKSDICVEIDSVMNYSFDIQMEDPNQHRRKRSVPDTTAPTHRRLRIFLKKGQSVDKFVNSIAAPNSATHFYKIVKMPDTTANNSHAVIDIFFT